MVQGNFAAPIQFRPHFVRNSNLVRPLPQDLHALPEFRIARDATRVRARPGRAESQSDHVQGFTNECKECWACALVPGSDWDVQLVDRLVKRRVRILAADTGNADQGTVRATCNVQQQPKVPMLLAKRRQQPIIFHSQPYLTGSERRTDRLEELDDLPVA